MKACSGLLCIFCLFAAVVAAAAEESAPAPAVPAGEDDPGLRARLLDFAGVLANEGFRLRDSTWSGRLASGRPNRLAVNLFAGNQYWFCAALFPPDAVAAITLYDPEGRAVPVLDHAVPGLAAAGVTAPVTGRYIVQIGTARGPAADFRLLYLFR